MGSRVWESIVCQQSCISTSPLAWSAYLRAQAKGSMERQFEVTSMDEEMSEPGGGGGATVTLSRLQIKFLALKCRSQTDASA